MGKDSAGNVLGCNKNWLGFTEDILIFSKNHQKHDFDGLHPLREYQYSVYKFINKSVSEISKITGTTTNSHYWTRGVQFSAIKEKDYKIFIEHFSIDQMNGFKTFTELKAIDTEYRTELLRVMNEQYPSTFNLWEGNKYKSNILKYKKDYDGHHPTQKPVLLLEDLIKTFSNEGDLVVDLTAGSFSTLVACVNTNRNGIGIELDKGYFDIGVKRIKTAQEKLSLFGNGRGRDD